MTTLVVPTLALDLSLLTRLANSIDYPLDIKIIINNGKRGALNDWMAQHPHWLIYESGYNKGCAGAWNMAPRICSDKEWWLISNDDQEFQPGCLEKICNAAIAHAKDNHILYVNPYDAFDMFVWTARGVRDFGLFDENFWPIYYEDYEMRLRFKIGGAKIHYVGDATFPVKHGKQAAGKPYHDMLAGCKPINEYYFMRKWGTLDDKNPNFMTPFNDPEKHINEWEFEGERRDQREIFWDAFWNVPNPSIY